MMLSRYYILFLIFLSSSLFAQLGDKITINGYSSFEFEKMFDDEGKGDPNGSYDADLFDLVLNFTPTDRLRIAADLTWEHGSATEDGRGNVAVEYAFGEYTVYDWLKLRAGKMFTPFGIYNEIHTAKPVFLTVKEPLSTNKNNKFGSDMRFYPRWSTGIAALGNFALSEIDFDYNLLISNGEQENTNPHEEDDNKEKSITGRLLFNPVEDLRVGFSVYTDQISELDSLDEITDGRTTTFSYGAQAEWNYNNFGIELEYVSGSFEPSGGDKINSNAYTAMVYYSINRIFTPYFRYEFLDPNDALDNDLANMSVIGINTKIDEGLYIKTEVDLVSSDDGNSRFEGNNYTEFKAAIAIGF